MGFLSFPRDLVLGTHPPGLPVVVEGKRAGLPDLGKDGFKQSFKEENDSPKGKDKPGERGDMVCQKVNTFSKGNECERGN